MRFDGGLRDIWSVENEVSQWEIGGKIETERDGITTCDWRDMEFEGGLRGIWSAENEISQ
jgi:hypothetical protein